MAEGESEIKIYDTYSYVPIHCIMLLLVRVIKSHTSESNLIVFEDHKEIPFFQPNVHHCNFFFFRCTKEQLPFLKFKQ